MIFAGGEVNASCLKNVDDSGFFFLFFLFFELCIQRVSVFTNTPKES